MATALTPTSELEAVNQMLATIMEAPLNSLEGVESLDAHKAVDTLSEVSRDIQQVGWHFNTERGLPLSPNALTGEVYVPTNCLSVDGYVGEQVDLVQRGQRLYDRTNQTYDIGRTVKVDMTILLGFHELPEAARRYIAVKACRLFQKRMVGSQTLDGFTAEDEERARMAFRRVVGQTGDHNIFNSPDMQRMLRRR